MAALNFTAAPRYRLPRSHVQEVERARSALFAIDPGCERKAWLRIAIAAKAAGLDESDFIAWSEGAANFDSERDCRDAWRKVREDGGISAASLFALARAAGWRDGSAETNTRPRFADVPRKPQEAPGAHAFDVAGVWASCEPATPGHAYVARKLGLPDGLRVVPADSSLRVARQSVAGWLAVPMFDGAAGDEPASLQFIGPDAGKLTAPGPMRGWFTVGGKPAPGATVYVCEGIGQAWSAHQATRSPAAVAFGAGRMESVARALLERIPGVRVVLVADVGKEADAERIAREVGCAWVAPPADLGKNGDVNDMHQRDGLDAVRALLSQAREPERVEPRFRVLTAEELAALPPVRWRVRGLLPAEGLAAIYGPPGSGKSFLALDLLGAVAEGRDWFDCRTDAAPVTYCALEGEAGIAQRVQAYRARYGKAPAGMRFIAQPFALLEPGDVAELADAIRAAGGAGGIVAIDTLNRASPGADENDSRDMGAIIAGAKLLQSALGGLVVLVHHSGKDSARGLRGHSSLLAALDAAVEVTRDGDRREWRTSKAKDGADGECHPFRLDVVELGIDDDGESVTSCVVTRGDAAENRPAAPVGGNQRVAWDRIGELLREAGDVRPEGAPAELPAGRPVVTLEAAIEAVAGRLVCEQKRRRERAMLAIQGLCGRGLLHHVEGWLWCA